MNWKKIRVLVVDDSFMFREVIARGISADVEIEVVAKAVDPFDARDKILEFKPDVMTCDVQMPKMNGIEFVRRLLPQYLLPVIVVSTISDAVFDAMNAGAVDFVTKPDVQSTKSLEEFITEMISKIKIAAHAKVICPKYPLPSAAIVPHFESDRMIAIGSSTGGTEALYSILKRLPASIPGIVIVQHIPPVFSRMFAERLNNQTDLTVSEARSGEFVEAGKVFIAPGDKHMQLKKTGSKFMIEVSSGEKVNGHCPSADVLFESVASEVGNKAVGVILTGMGSDGAKGLLAMRRNGAHTLGQDEQSSVVYGMPKVAFKIGAVEKQAPLSNIPDLLMALLKK
ncbi:MAG: chemotaxis response regulator protein-glutamate methylesterase [Clostridiales bacterium]|nr:chemotaxis response regulator protein-glutamate methylesterase [Clostridiales bacterium]